MESVLAGKYMSISLEWDIVILSLLFNNVNFLNIQEKTLPALKSVFLAEPVRPLHILFQAKHISFTM